MDLFFERYNLPKPTQEETDHLNSPMSIKEIKFVAKSHPKKRERERKKTPGPYGLTGKFQLTFKEKNNNVSI